jgi:hypothetical protein
MKFRYQKIPFFGHDPRKPLIPRPLIPVYLHGKERSIRSPYYALLDSGADNVLFPADLTKEINIADIAQGRRESIIGIAGQRAEAYFFDLELQILGDTRRLLTVIGFSDQIFIPILGRSFFAHFKSITFSETKGEVELKI